MAPVIVIVSPDGISNALIFAKATYAGDTDELIVRPVASAYPLYIASISSAISVFTVIRQSQTS